MIIIQLLFYVLRKEIINKLPKVKTYIDDLYVYIRGGDIFRRLNKSIAHYSQPPLCFYRKIFNEFIFREVTIISEDKSNPVFSKLVNEYPYIKFNKNNIKLDLSYLANSYNIVSATSSFLINIIKLNDNLKFLWEYDLYLLSEKYVHLHHSVYSFSYNYTIYKMEPSSKYKKLVGHWTNSKEQREMIIKEKCNNYFSIIGPRI